MKRLFLLLVMLPLFFSCTKDDSINYETLHIFPDREVIYVQEGQSSFVEMSTESDKYNIEFIKYDGKFRLAVASHELSIGQVNLSGVDTNKPLTVDINWKVQNKSFSVTGDLIKTPYYVLILYENN